MRASTLARALPALATVWIAGWLPACGAAAAPAPVVIIGQAAPDVPPTPEELEALKERRRAEEERNDKLKSAGRIRIVHTARRTHDAQTVLERLRRLGADVFMFETSDSGNGPHLGRLYVKEGYEKYAPVIIRTIHDIETVEMVSGDGFSDGETFSLWVAK